MLQCSVYRIIITDASFFQKKKDVGKRKKGTQVLTSMIRACWRDSVADRGGATQRTCIGLVRTRGGGWGCR